MASSESLLLDGLIQLILIIAAARILGHVFGRFGQPMVCGEIAAGLLLGPSVFGYFFQSAFRAVFVPSGVQNLNVLSQIGVVFLMFLIGLEFDFGHLKDNRRAGISVSAAGILLPFILGFALGGLMHAQLGLGGSALNFSLFLATAMSITAVPVLGRILIELNLNRTRIGSITMFAAAVNDASGWIILAVITAIVQATFHPMKTALMIAAVVLYAGVMVLIVRPLICRWSQRVFERNNGDLSLNAQALLLILLLASAAITNLIGIFSIFGGFLFGAILYDQHALREAVNRRLRDFITVFFLPVFFTYTGLRTDAGSLATTQLWLFCGIVLLLSMAGKFLGCAAAARINGLPRNEALMIGVMMNTRGLMELIVINLGYDLGIIPKSVFFMLVTMAVGTTYMTTPILRRLVRKTEAWASYSASPFAARLEAMAGTERSDPQTGP